MSASPMDMLREFDESVGFSIADAAPFKQRQHVDYAKDLVELELTSNALAFACIAKGCIHRMAAFTHIHYRTLKDWRMHLLNNPHWWP
jgi:hypothetical protein